VTRTKFSVDQMETKPDNTGIRLLPGSCSGQWTSPSAHFSFRAEQGFMQRHTLTIFWSVLFAVFACIVVPSAFGSTPVSHKKKKTASAKKKAAVAVKPATAPVSAAKKPVAKKASTSRTAARTAAVATVVASRASAKTGVKKKAWVQTWDEPTFKESTSADHFDGEDLEVRKAAVEALGPLNGAVVVVDPTNGRVLSMVNQPLALGNGFQPCSTVKVPVALAALREGVVERTSPIRLYGRRTMDLTEALAHSNNFYFANLGTKLGYERVNYYAHLFGYGEKAGLNIPGEHPGRFPSAPPKNGGVGMLTSFGEEISQTPLQLAAMMTAVANGGTLYWLQYPQSQAEVQEFQPQIKRHLDIKGIIPEVKPGMQGAVEYGTAKRAKQDDVILGKTGTCSEGRTRLGWFGSFNESGKRKLVVVVMLTGGRPSIGPAASGVAGDVFRRLAADNYLKTPAAITAATILPATLCCKR